MAKIRIPPLSVLDLVSVREDGTVGEALANSTRAAQLAEELGYKRLWVAEHHGMPAIAGGATSVILAHLADATSTIRIGAGGIMLPNHNPFVIAEQFGTLDALHPGRIDLGLGRAPGADSRIAQALRKDLMTASTYFPQDVAELRDYLTGQSQLQLQPTAGPGSDIELWILGSSLFGAQLAAHFGMPYAFASHFAPAQLDAALAMYRERFQPSEVLDRPYVMAAITVLAAPSDEEAAYLATSMDQSFVALHSGNPGRLKPPLRGYRDTLSPLTRETMERMRAVSAVGSPETVRREIVAFAERTGADELMTSTTVWDPELRLESLRLTQEALEPHMSE